MGCGPSSVARQLNDADDEEGRQGIMGNRKKYGDDEEEGEDDFKGMFEPGSLDAFGKHDPISLLSQGVPVMPEELHLTEQPIRRPSNGSQTSETMKNESNNDVTKNVQKEASFEFDDSKFDDSNGGNKSDKQSDGAASSAQSSFSKQDDLGFANSNDAFGSTSNDWTQKGNDDNSGKAASKAHDPMEASVKKNTSRTVSEDEIVKEGQEEPNLEWVASESDAAWGTNEEKSQSGEKDLTPNNETEGTPAFDDDWEATITSSVSSEIHHLEDKPENADPEKSKRRDKSAERTMESPVKGEVELELDDVFSKTKSPQKGEKSERTSSKGSAAGKEKKKKSEKGDESQEEYSEDMEHSGDLSTASRRKNRHGSESKKKENKKHKKKSKNKSQSSPSSEMTMEEDGETATETAFWKDIVDSSQSDMSEATAEINSKPRSKQKKKRKHHRKSREASENMIGSSASGLTVDDDDASVGSYLSTQSSASRMSAASAASKMSTRSMPAKRTSKKTRPSRTHSGKQRPSDRERRHPPRSTSYQDDKLSHSSSRSRQKEGPVKRTLSMPMQPRQKGSGEDVFRLDMLDINEDVLSHMQSIPERDKSSRSLVDGPSNHSDNLSAPSGHSLSSYLPPGMKSQSNGVLGASNRLSAGLGGVGGRGGAENIMIPGVDDVIQAAKAKPEQTNETQDDDGSKEVSPEALGYHSDAGGSVKSEKSSSKKKLKGIFKKIGKKAKGKKSKFQTMDDEEDEDDDASIDLPLPPAEEEEKVNKPKRRNSITGLFKSSGGNHESSDSHLKFPAMFTSSASNLETSDLKESTTEEQPDKKPKRRASITNLIKRTFKEGKHKSSEAENNSDNELAMDELKAAIDKFEQENEGIPQFDPTVAHQIELSREGILKKGSHEEDDENEDDENEDDENEEEDDGPVNNSLDTLEKIKNRRSIRERRMSVQSASSLSKRLDEATTKRASTRGSDDGSVVSASESVSSKSGHRKSGHGSSANRNHRSQTDLNTDSDDGAGEGHRSRPKRHVSSDNIEAALESVAMSVSARSRTSRLRSHSTDDSSVVSESASSRRKKSGSRRSRLDASETSLDMSFAGSVTSMSGRDRSRRGSKMEDQSRRRRSRSGEGVPKSPMPSKSPRPYKSPKSPGKSPGRSPGSSLRRSKSQDVEALSASMASMGESLSGSRSRRRKVNAANSMPMHKRRAAVTRSQSSVSKSSHSMSGSGGGTRRRSDRKERTTRSERKERTIEMDEDD